MIKENMPLGDELEKLWNYPLFSLAIFLKLFSRRWQSKLKIK